MAVIFVLVVLAFVLAMTAVYALPQRRLMRNARDSVAAFKTEGFHPQILSGSPSYWLDNWTDPMMLDTSIVSGPGGPVLHAMAATHGRSPTAARPYDPIVSLADTAAGHRVQPLDYSYYWHGYQVVLRPLLVVFRYMDIRWIAMVVLGALGLAVVLALDRIAGWEAALAFFVAMAAVGAWLVPLNLNYGPPFYVMTLAVLAILFLAHDGEIDRLDRLDLEIFMIVGMLTSFADLLTAPVLTLGIPLAVVFILQARYGPVRPFLGSLWRAVKLSAVWVVGYGGAWAAKWVIGSLVLRHNVVAMAIGEAFFRGGYSFRQGPRPLYSLYLNVSALFPFGLPVAGKSLVQQDPMRFWTWAIALAVVVGAAVFLLVRYHRSAEELKRILPVLLVVPLPYIWFVAVNNHSTVLYWFTYRIQAGAIFAIVYAAIAAIDWKALPGVRQTAVRSREASPAATPSTRSADR